MLVLATGLGVAAAGLVFSVVDRYAGNVERIEGVFDGLDESSRPDPMPTADGATGPLTFLLVGSDSRLVAAAGQLPDARSDVLMLLRLSADRGNVQVISIPRDSWVMVPGHGMAKINAAYAWGGPALLIETVEALTDIRIDHFGAIDFTGFQTIIDAVGGIDVEVAQTTDSRGVTFTAGTNHLNGAEALIYARQRYDLPRGDLDRVQRHQQVLRAVLIELREHDFFGDLDASDELFLALTSSLRVDDELSNLDLVDLLLGLRNIDGPDVGFLTAPVLGLGREGAQSVVYLNIARSAQLWSYLAADQLAAHLGEFAADALPVSSR